MKNAQALSPISISWTKKYVAPRSEEESLALMHVTASPKTFFSPANNKLILQDGKLYFSVPDQGSGGILEKTFDGELFCSGSPDIKLINGVEQPQLTKFDLDHLKEKQPLQNWILADYMQAAGYRVPSSSIDFIEHRPLSSEVLYLLDAEGGKLQEATSVQYEGKPALRVTIAVPDPDRKAALAVDLAAKEKDIRQLRVTEAFVQGQLDTIRHQRELPELRLYEFTLDPAMNYAVRQRETRYADGRLILRSRGDAFEAVGDRGIWLPKNMHTDYFTWPAVAGTFAKTPMLSQTIEVTDIALKRVPDGTFRPEYKKGGSVIIDNTRAATRPSYIVAGSVDELNASLDKALSASPALHVAAATSTSWMRYLVVNMALALIVAAGVVWALRHRDRGHNNVV